MRLNYLVHVDPAGGIENLVLDLAAETEREELLLRFLERGEIADKLTCRLQDGKILSATIVVLPPAKTTYVGAIFSDKIVNPEDLCEA